MTYYVKRVKKVKKGQNDLFVTGDQCAVAGELDEPTVIRSGHSSRVTVHDYVLITPHCFLYFLNVTKELLLLHDLINIG